MPEEIELNKERRKQLAELMLEYPTKTEEEENLIQNPTMKRHYACLNCRNPFSAIRGKLNHRRYNPKCKEVPRHEEFTNECKDCNRIFCIPSLLKEHIKYICILQEEREKEEHLEPTLMDKTPQKII